MLSAGRIEPEIILRTIVCYNDQYLDGNLENGSNFIDVENGHDVGRDVDDDLVRVVDWRGRDIRL